jgi:2-polyprenyl-6-hydroxyphenyl methylase/3-demethylubiquinone-9 3-methyltransferase
MMEEIEKFTSIADSWWDINGPFKQLHKINPIRLEYICNKIREHIGKESVNGLKILDIGCGGGIVSVPLARLGANVTGIDLGAENIAAAKEYAVSKGLEIEYIHSDISVLESEYDVILCLEVVEHVDDLKKFVENISKLLKPNGIVILSTINRTIKGFAFAIAAAEYILQWVPRGTHNFDRFVKPSELANMLESHNINVLDIMGMSYNIFNKRWFLSDDIDVNYFLSGIKLL